ncbi:MAG: hypothetical protein CTY15_09950 [Methylocystis sp.]|nr:MAG: hypothetical protein CTY15_09950 [Methylocystis sp.]
MIVRLAALAERFGVGASLLGALFSLSAKVLGSVLGLLAFAIATRSMPASDFGVVAITFNIASFLATVGVLGQDALIIRNWAETRAEKDDGASRGALIFGAGVTLLSSLAAALAFVLLCRANAAAHGIWNLPLPGGADVIASAAVFLIGQALLHFVSHAARAICGVAVSEPHSEVTWRLVLVICFSVATFLGYERGATIFFSAAALGCFVAVAVQSTAILRRLDATVRAAAPVMRVRAWARRSASILSAVTAEAASQYAEVVVIGLVSSSTVSAAYFVVARIAGVFPMIAAGFHGYLSSRFANLFYARRQEEAQRLIGKVMMLAALVVCVLGLLLVAFGDRLLGLFGASYAAERLPLLALSCGLAFSTLMGPGAGVLLATGHELFYSRLLIVSILARTLGLALLTPTYGLLGAAAVIGLVVASLSASIAYYCRKRVGIDPSIVGFFLSPR